MRLTREQMKILDHLIFDRLHGYSGSNLPAELASNRDLIFRAVKKYGRALGFASEALRSDREVVLVAVKQDGGALKYVSEALRADREVVLEAVTQDGWALEYAPESLCADREIVLTAVKQAGGAFKYAPKSLRADRNFVLEAVEQNGMALEYASKALRTDRNFVLEAAKRHGMALSCAPYEIRADRNFILETTKRHGMALQFASYELRANREIVLGAVKQAGEALQYASDPLRADREVVLEAVKQDGMAFKYASEELRADQEFAMKAVTQNTNAIQFAAYRLRSKRDFVLKAVRLDGNSLVFASPKLRADREVVMAAVTQNGKGLKYASDELRADKEVVLAAVKNYGNALAYASEELSADREIVMAAVTNDEEAIVYASEEPLKERNSESNCDYTKNGSITKAVEITDKKKEAGSAYEQLTELIGLDEVKKVICQAKDYFMAQRIFKEKGFWMTDRPSMSMVFTGNPGSCKTTVARLIAEIFRDCGILSEGRMIECGRGDLVGKYLGHTAPMVQQKFREAKGSVLFIDEAYSLVDDRDGMFGDEAINTIVREMENHRDDVLVIFAGYPDKMEGFLDKNPGLRSRIAFHVHFADYNADELCQISEQIAKGKGLTISAPALEKMHGIYEKISKEPDFGNGRAARNIVESAQMAMATRLLRGDVTQLTEKEITTVLPEDISEPALISSSQTVRRANGF